MTAVPVASDLFRGTPRAGSNEQVEAVARYLDELWTNVVNFSSSVLSAQTQLAQLEGTSVTALKHKLDSVLMPAAAAVEDAAITARAAIRVHGTVVYRVHREADRLEAAATRRLRGIREEWRTIDRIAEAIRARTMDHWEAPPGINMPEPSLRDDASGLDAGERQVQLQLLRDAYQLSWQRAAQRWHDDLSEIRLLRARWDGLVDERMGAERALVGSLHGTTVAQLASFGQGLPGGRTQAVALGLTGELGGVVRPPVTWRTDHPLLESLWGSDGISSATGRRPDPARVVSWWAGLTAAQRDELMLSVPTTIGNLGGLLPSVRDRANRIAIDGFRANPQLLDAEARRVLAEIQQLLDRAAAQRIEWPPIQVYSLELGNGVPTAAIGYGNLDTSTHTSWLVPGMGSDASDALPAWDSAGRNLFQVQSSLLRRGEGGAPAVVAWLGYETPKMPPSREVLRSDRALVGAERLAAELDAMAVSRLNATVDRPVTNVIAHSYGTTVAASALTRISYPVDTFVMLGSAGLDPREVPELAGLRVQRTDSGLLGIYASNAPADRLAPTGAALAGRPLPTHQSKPLLGVPQRFPDYDGAIEFPSAGDAARRFAATDGHSFLGEGPRAGPFGLSASSGQGYGDLDTQALNTTARITTQMFDRATLDSLQVRGTAR
ncbi:alpha/beta hydrolase [Leucobacter sp. BZR 635]